MSLRSRARTAIEHSVVAVAVAMLSWLAARALHLHQPQWAVISAVVVIQDDWRATRVAAWNRFLGTTLGALLALGMFRAPLHPILQFGIAAAIGVFLCYVAGIGPAARLCCVTLAITLLIRPSEPTWHYIYDRFIEVNVGIAVAVSWIFLQHKFWRDLAPPPTVT